MGNTNPNINPFSALGQQFFNYYLQQYGYNNNLPNNYLSYAKENNIEGSREDSNIAAQSQLLQKMIQSKQNPSQMIPQMGNPIYSAFPMIDPRMYQQQQMYGVGQNTNSNFNQMNPIFSS